MTMTPRLRKFWTLLILLGGMVGSMFISGQWAWQRSLQEENRSVQGQLAWGERLGVLFTGISLGSILLLVALGLAITYGLMGVINMAHGELMMIGAYATYVVQGPNGKREIAAKDFYKGFLESALAADEMLVEIKVPKMNGAGWSFQKFNRRAVDWAIVGVAAWRNNGDSGVALLRRVKQALDPEGIMNPGKVI